MGNPASMLPYLDPSINDDPDGTASNGRSQLTQALILNSMAGSTIHNETGGEVGSRQVDTQTDSSNPHPDNSQANSSPNPMAGFGSEGGADGSDLANIKPAGFDDMGNPTQFPATQPKEQAYDKLQKANQTLSNDRAKDTSPGSILKRTALSMVPLVGPAYMGALKHNRSNAREDVANANDQYQFQSKEEESQREAAIRERTAMTGLEYTRAAKNLMAQIANKKADITKSVGDTRNQVTAAGKGYDVTTNPDGTEKVTPRAEADLSSVASAHLELQQAQTELTKAKATAVPEQVKIAQTRADNATRALEALIQHRQFQEGLEREGMDFRETGPTMGTRNMQQMSTVLQPRVDKLIQDTDQISGKIGPVAGRWNDFWQGKVGADDPQFAKYKDDMEYLSSAMAIAHARGRIPASVAEKFDTMYEAGKQSPANMKAALGVAKEWLGDYSHASSDLLPDRQATPADLNGGQGGSAPSKLKRRSTSGGNGGPPPAANTRTVKRDPKTGTLTF